MEETFELPVAYEGKQFYFPSRLVPSGYVHRFDVSIEGADIWFEPDEERNYRALVDADKVNTLNIDTELLKAVAEALASLSA